MSSTSEFVECGEKMLVFGARRSRVIILDCWVSLIVCISNMNRDDDDFDLYADLDKGSISTPLKVDIIEEEDSTQVVSNNNNNNKYSSCDTSSSSQEDVKKLEQLITELTSKNEQLNNTISSLTKDKENFKKVNEILMKNISCLFKTAMVESQRKDKEIETLRNQNDQLIKTNHNHNNNNKR
ncbi:hypothetical protein DFA_03154 [Cavenderia fasciculata]|uniref:Uncharacterized protein n=1 Tax=Cavenderia fasciculata TaxID=261658 RepID=F4PGS5_CACFS|nr:uncharacterized protein DFA_03154 [Cavenderia fasciculata]EGG24909.1 hypothetical protein DFA_03154 [Cavenderia fasciculata]|eukprot:XP_004362760.1 hypothetical protein DFA_03154 [Cavenderia fasciculata]